jgi:hypothetical protein
VPNRPKANSNFALKKFKSLSIYLLYVRPIDGTKKITRRITPVKTKRRKTMRFMMLVKHGEGKNSGPPPKALMDAIDRITEEAVKNGTMVMGGGLASTAQSHRVRLSGGKVSVTDGPFTETKEVVGGFAIFDLKSKEEALEGAKHFMDLHRQHWPGWEGETEVRQLYGPEEFPPKA